jgi:hypothetical protein
MRTPASFRVFSKNNWPRVLSLAAGLALGAPAGWAQSAPAAAAPNASSAPTPQELRAINSALKAALSQADPAIKSILDQYPNYAPLRAPGGGGGRGPANIVLPPVPVVGEAGAILLEDFEATPVGKIPDGFTATGKVAVSDDFAHSGTKSLKMEAAKNGPRRITLTGDKVAALGGTFWGRLYFKVQVPFPLPPPSNNPVIHSTLVSGSATSPEYNDRIEVRMLDSVMNQQGMYQYIYNVQPSGGRPEFGKGGAYTHAYTSDWTLAEWYVDSVTQTYRLFINGTEITDVTKNNGAGNFDGTELPEVFRSLSFGWNNYQAADPGFVAWIDDIALSKQRIGPHEVPAPPAVAAPAAASAP